MPAIDIPRYLEKYENAAASISYVFPTLGYEYEATQEVREQGMDGVGLNFGVQPAQRRILLGQANETARFVLDADTAALLDAAYDTMKAAMFNISPGWLYTLGADTTRRKAWAEIVSLPDLQMDYRNSMWLPASIGWRRYTHWLATAPTTGTGAALVNGSTFVINNPGNVPARLMVLRVRANAAGFNNPKLTNVTNGFVLQTTRDSVSINSEVKYDLEQAAVYYSNDDGVSYVDDYVNYYAAIASLPVGQNPLTFQLQPGNNTIRYEDSLAGNVNVDYSFNAPFL